jgi:hypothetical protein
MNGRRRLLGAVGLGSLLAGVTAVVPREGFAATATPQPTVPPIAPEQRPQYKVFTVSAGDSIEDAFNAVAREGFQYAGSAQRYGNTEFIFVKWVRAEPVVAADAAKHAQDMAALSWGTGDEIGALPTARS